MEGLAAALEGTTLAQALRGGRWGYALVNAAHITGIALLFGSIAALDLRLLGFGRQTDIRPLARQLLPVSMTGLCLAILAGFLLFMVNAADYLSQPLFFLKLALIALAILNAVALHRSAAWRAADAYAPPWRLKAAAALSLLLWLAVIISGRLLAFV